MLCEEDEFHASPVHTSARCMLGEHARRLTDDIITFVRKKPRMYKGQRGLSAFVVLTRRNFFAESSRLCSTRKCHDHPTNRKDEFCRRHIGPNQYEQQAMLRELGLKKKVLEFFN
uniref:Uncharacterized protein n=1 Tax=Romanomermis culicivorax TaxID=13658 RepID=A0A915HMV6_ROMCU